MADFAENSGPVRRTPTWVSATSALVTIIAIGTIEWRVGYEISLSTLYFAPIALGAWELGLGWAVVFSVVAAVVWAGADGLSGHVYMSALHAVWNTAIRLASFLAIGWSVSTTRKVLATERNEAEALRRSMSEIKVLESFLPICAQCKKIRNQKGEWQVLESYIGEHANTQFSHGYCPECLQEAMREAGLTDHPSPHPPPGRRPPRYGS